MSITKTNIIKSGIVVMLSLIIGVFSCPLAYAVNFNSLEELAQQKEDAIAKFEEATEKQNKIQSEIDNIEKDIAIIDNNLKTKEKKLYKMVVSSYTSDMNQVDIFVSAIMTNASLGDLFKNLDYLDRYIANQNDLVSEVKADKEALEAKKAEIEKKKAEVDKLVATAEVNKRIADKAYNELKDQITEELKKSGYTGDFPKGWLTVSEMKFTGAVDANGFHYTYYSELVLPGGGLRIPGRHTESCGCVCDEDGYICVASDPLSNGTLVPTPLKCHPVGKVYDCGVGRYDGIDLYVH